jgi:hypothetical protein
LEGSTLDWLTFISSVVRDTAWPIVALSAFVIFSYKGNTFIKLIKSLKYKDFEISTREEFAEAREDAEHVKQQLSIQPKIEFQPSDRILKLAEMDSAVAIIDVWKKLEDTIISVIQHHGQMRYTTPENSMLKLTKLGKLSKNDLNLYRSLRKIRNENVHSHHQSKLTLAEVMEYEGFVEILINKLNQIKSESGCIDLTK